MGTTTFWVIIAAAVVAVVVVVLLVVALLKMKKKNDEIVSKVTKLSEFANQQFDLDGDKHSAQYSNSPSRKPESSTFKRRQTFKQSASHAHLPGMGNQLELPGK